MSKYRVLVVDDESDMRQLVGMYLDNFGYEWGEAENGKEALKKLETDHYDFVVLDIMMPEMDGLSVCKEIRKTSDVPIIFLTAKGEEWNRVNGLRMGADDYIVKPFSTIEFIARVKAQLRRYTYFNQNAVQVIEKKINIRGLEIDEVSRTVVLYGETINLTKTEYDILYLMAAAKNRVFTIEEIYESVWKERAYESNNTVMVHIARLRNKIEENPKEPKFIQNVWGVGYKIED